MKKKGTFVGLSTVDVIYGVREGPTRNQKVAARSQLILVGGPATNAAVTFAHLGGSATVVSSVGHHPLSHTIKDEFRQFDIAHLDLTPESDEAPPISSVWVDDEGNRSVVSANTAGRLISPVRIDPAALDNVSVLMVDGHAMQACQLWARAAKSAGVPVVLDAGSWKPGTDLLLGSVDIAICSADFLPPGCSTGEDVTSYLLAAGVAKFAITRGTNPIRFVSDTGTGTVDVPQIAAVDTAGAGDIFHGAFCFFYANGRGFEGALKAAAIIASESCCYPGTRQWMKHGNSTA